MDEFLVKSFGGCCGSTVLTSTSCWPSTNCIPVQKVVSMSTELIHNRSAFVLDSDNGVCCHHSSSYSIQGRNEVGWGLGQEASLAPPRLKLRSSEANVLY